LTSNPRPRRNDAEEKPEKRRFRQDLQDHQDEMPNEKASPNGVTRFPCWSFFYPVNPVHPVKIQRFQ
jgi:hypothetical protein